MKKILLSVLMLAAGMTAANAADAYISFPDQGWANQYDLDGQTVNADQVAITFSVGAGQTTPKYFTSGTSVRLYAGNTISFAVPDGGTITKIDMELRDYSYNKADDDSGYTASSGTFTADPYDAYTASWEGSAQNVTITVNNEQNSAGKWPQFHIRAITIVYSAGVETECAAPRFSLDEGTYYTAQQVELTTSTADAKIMYAINGGAEQEYNAPIELSEVGKYTISAYAMKDGLDNSATAEATYEIAAPIEVGSIDEFIMNGESDPEAVYKWTFPVTVTAQMSGYLYVKDNNEGAMVIYGNDVPTYEAGDVIPAGIVGEYANFNGLYEMQYPEASSFGEATENVEVSYPRMTPGEITDADMNKVIYIVNSVYTDNDNGKTMSDASGSINVYYQSRWEVESGVSGQEYDLLCAVAVYKDAVQVYPIEWLDAGAGVEGIEAEAAQVVALDGAVRVNADGNVQIYNAAGQLVASEMVEGSAEINVPAGFYIVRAADTVCKVIVR